MYRFSKREGKCNKAGKISGDGHLLGFLFLCME